MTETRLTRIIELVSEAFGVAPLDILSSDRHKTVAEARHVVCWLARETTRMSYPEIGRALGDRDHTTVMSACKRVARRFADDRWLERRANELRDRLLAEADARMPVVLAPVVKIRVAPIAEPSSGEFPVAAVAEVKGA